MSVAPIPQEPFALARLSQCSTRSFRPSLKHNENSHLPTWRSYPTKTRPFPLGTRPAADNRRTAEHRRPLPALLQSSRHGTSPAGQHPHPLRAHLRGQAIIARAARAAASPRLPCDYHCSVQCLRFSRRLPLPPETVRTHPVCAPSTPGQRWLPPPVLADNIPAFNGFVRLKPPWGVLALRACLWSISNVLRSPFPAHTHGHATMRGMILYMDIIHRPIP